MKQVIQTINEDVIQRLKYLPTESQDVVIISSFFDPKRKELLPQKTLSLSENSKSIVKNSCRTLKYGGMLFVYGIPSELWLWAEHLMSLRDKNVKFVFKYWIALDIDNRPRKSFLTPTHQGLLMFLKSKANRKNLSRFVLNTKEVRIPHAFCKACKRNVKDWGGKKHLMNPKGTCISDVWKDLPKLKVENNIIPDLVLERIIDLTTTANKPFVTHIIQQEEAIEVANRSVDYSFKSLSSEWDNLMELKENTAYKGDCIPFLHRLSNVYPEGIFDLVFADPPYNLCKAYNKYEDELADREYLDWCKTWLYGMYKVLKPGGAFFILNLPKWAVYHAAFLGQYLDFRHWIVWDALSEPRGKIMPAHYALLYYTKPGGCPKFNYSSLNSKPTEGFVLPPDSPDYCIRAKCIKTRKLLGDNEKVELSDIWADLHRIKHKKDRDAHPCQLPDSLMERIIMLTTDPGDFVFDPLGGAGTTATLAFKLNRKFVITDIDQKYVDITNKKINEMQRNKDLFGKVELTRQPTKRAKKNGSKREVETYLQDLARKLGKVPNEVEIQVDKPEILQKIDELYPNRSSAIKRCKVALV